MKLFNSVNDPSTKGERPRERRALLAARALIDRMRAMYRELEQLTGAPIAAHRALTVIGAEPGIAAAKLAVAIGMRKSALSHVLKYLVERDWAERVRDAADQRSVRLFVTPEGRKLLQATSGRAVGTLQRSVARLSDEELAGLALGLESVLKHLPEVSPTVAVRRPRSRAVKRPARP